jgi:hypothetical protein
MHTLIDLQRDTWAEFAADAYLDARHRNWILSEEFGDVLFVAARGVVLVHRERAQHIAEALGAGRDVARLEGPVPEPMCLPARCAAGPARPSVVAVTSRWPEMLGTLGILLGAAVLVAALAVPLNDAGLVLGCAVVLRGGPTILNAEDQAR